MRAKSYPKVSKLKIRNDGTGPNPTYKKGERNIFCPHYCKCLDFAIYKSWEFWACFDCSQKTNQQPINEYPCTRNDSVLYHSLPQEIYAKVG